METKNVEPFLEHYGIKGMRWGVRRDLSGSSGSGGTKSSTNKSRTVTKSSPNKSGSSGKGSTKTPDNNRKKGDTEDAVPPKQKTMSDAELRKAVERLRMEAEFSRLSATPELKKQQSVGAAFVRSAAKDVILPAAKNAARDVLTQYAKNAASQLLAKKLGVNNPDLANAIWNVKKKK